VAHAIELWTDGACSGNPGPGGWAAILVARGPGGAVVKQVELSGGDPATTNNRMELQAVISGLASLQRPTELTVHIDSSYVMDAIVKRWHVGWVARGWKTAAKQPVKNADLWQALLDAAKPHRIEWVWVKGHAGHPDNERVDKLASDAAVKAGRS